MMLLHDLQLFKAEFFKVLAHPVRADALSAWMVALVGVVAGLAAVEAPHYAHGAARRFYPFFHLFVFTMLLAVTTDDLGFMWVAIEGTTLASVFLVNFERTRASLEAFYKDVLICSVGIAVAFLGTVLVYFADIAYFAGTGHVLRWTTAAPRPRPASAHRGDGLRVPAGRLRHQGGTGAHAHLVAGRPQRGAGAGERNDVRRPAGHCV